MDRPADFIQGSRQFCPWCEEWDSIQAFIALQTPPGHSDTCATIYKHGGESGCKKLHAPVMVVLRAVSA